MKYCDICRSNLSDSSRIALTKQLTQDDSIDLCVDCVTNKRRLGVFHIIVEATQQTSIPCDFCRQLVGTRYHIINVHVNICASCMDLQLTLEEVSERFHALINSSM